MLIAEEFVKGQLDCQDGKPHKEGQSKSYDRGYAAQYELEQVQTAESELNVR